MFRPNLFLRCLLAGVAAAFIASFASWAFDFVMDLIGFSFVPFGFPGHLVTLGFLNIVGIIPLLIIGRFVSQPAPAYYTLTITVAIALSILVFLKPPYTSGFTLYVAIAGFLFDALVSAVVATQIAFRSQAPAAGAPVAA